MDKELHLHKRVDICAEQTIYKLRQLSACDRDWRPAWLQPGKRLITGSGAGAAGERRRAATRATATATATGNSCSDAEEERGEEEGQGRESGQVLRGIYLISSCPRKNLGIFNRMSLNFMCVLPHRWGCPAVDRVATRRFPARPAELTCPVLI